MAAPIAATKLFKSSAANLAAVNSSGGVHVLWGYAEPDTIGERLRRAGVPRTLDALKVDIDSTGLPTLRGVLASGFRPKVLMVEINPDIPPPISWHVAHAPLPSNKTPSAMWCAAPPSRGVRFLHPNPPAAPPSRGFRFVHPRP